MFESNFPFVEITYIAINCSLFQQELGIQVGTVNSNTVNSKFHLIQIFCEMFSYHFPIISCLKMHG